MKLCFFSGDISKTGGTERVSLLIANKLAERGYNVSFLSYQYGEKTSFDKFKTIRLFSMHMERSTGFFERKVYPYIKLLSFLRTEKPDILINIDVILCLYSLPLKLFSNIKIIAWEHFNFRSNDGVKNRDIARKFASKYADQIIVLTKADKAEYERNLKIRNRIDFIYNPSVGILMDEDATRENIVIASGRLSHPKNFIDLLKIWQIVGPKNKSWELYICGDGEKEAELKQYVKDNHIQNIIFAGFIKNIEHYYKKAKIMVMTSIYEGFPMVLLEAQKAGLPIVSYDTFTGPGEIVIDGVDGYLVEQGNIEEFANKLNGLMNNENDIRKFSEQAILDSSRFEIEDIVDQWEDIIGELYEK